MTIDELIERTIEHQILAENHNTVELTVSNQWAQGRTLFGGLSAGLAYLVCKPLVDDERVLRSFTVNFVGPLLFDVPFQIKAHRLRSGKNVSQLSVQITQNEKTSLVAQACFGVGRKSSVRVENTDTHTMPEPSKAKFIPQIPKVTPRFLRNFDLSIQSGGVPFLNGKESHYHGWMRFKKPPKEITDVHVITLIDAWPPTLLQMLKWPAPASTVSWNLEFIHPHKVVQPTDWFAYQSRTRQAADGYGHTEANIWDAAGDLVAISRQTVAIFD